MKERSSNSQTRPSVRRPDRERQKQTPKSQAVVPGISDRLSSRNLRTHQTRERSRRETVATVASIRPRLGRKRIQSPPRPGVGAFDLPIVRIVEYLYQLSCRYGLCLVDTRQ